MIEKWQQAMIETYKNTETKSGKIEAAWCHNVLLAEIALQFSQMNETLTRIAATAEKQGAVLD